MYSSQQELNSIWIKLSYKRGRSTQKETEREAKHTEGSKHWLNQTFSSNHYTALLEEKSKNQQHKAGPENTPKPPPVYITDVKNILPLIQLLEQIAKHQYEIKAESYRTISHLQIERSYRAVLKICTTSSTQKKSKLKLRN
jgi:hypothetical protein